MPRGRAGRSAARALRPRGKAGSRAGGGEEGGRALRRPGTRKRSAEAVLPVPGSSHALQRSQVTRARPQLPVLVEALPGIGVLPQGAPVARTRATEKST